MFFILSKTLVYLILPVPFLALLLIIFLLVRNRKLKRVFLILFCSFFFLYTNPFLANYVMRWWETPATPIAELEEAYDAAIILSGVTDTDKYPQDRVHTNKGADRILHTLQLYKLGKVPLIIVSGGSGKLITEEEAAEAELIKRVLLLSGVAEKDIMTEEESRNTYENALFTTRLIKEKNLAEDKLLLVTSAFHMRRSLASFKKAGLLPRPYAVDFYAGEPEYTPDHLLIPDPGAINQWTKLISEWTGCLMYRMSGYI